MKSVQGKSGCCRVVLGGSRCREKEILKSCPLTSLQLQVSPHACADREAGKEHCDIAMMSYCDRRIRMLGLTSHRGGTCRLQLHEDHTRRSIFGMYDDYAPEACVETRL
jgi:hypothetical protein